MAAKLMPVLERRLKAEVAGDVLFDRFSRGRYATDASHYQMMPLGVVVPRTVEDAERAIALARAEGASVLPRGAGTSQGGQTVNESLVIDCSKSMNKILELDVAGRRCSVEPGIVLDDLNRALKPHQLWFPVDISTASRATIGGMTGNNSCGGRSLRYGNTRENVLSIDAVLADGTRAHFGPVGASSTNPLANSLLALGKREAAEIKKRFPKVQRRVGGYNIDALVPGKNDANLAHILVGSEGTLAFTTRVELKLWPVLGKRAIGACHFGKFYEAMNTAQHIVKLGPIAVELIDRTMIELASDIEMFGPTLQQFVRGKPEAILLVEFGEDDQQENIHRLKQLEVLMGDLGFGWDKQGKNWGGVIEVLEPALQAAITDIRTSGLNIMMSMKEQGKPISFVEDCTVPLEHLAEYTSRLTDLFERKGTRGTWYAHASVGCLHVRPVLNLRQEKDVNVMRAIAEEAFEIVREYKGSHSGEHGDGIVRSEFHEKMFGTQIIRAFEQVKDSFDPNGLYNPGKIIRAPKFDDRTKFRYSPNYRAGEMKTALDWSSFTGAGGGFQGAVEMCNNNGACRKEVGDVMCPSFRVTHEERDVTRGRANSLRLAISGQLGSDAFTSDEMIETLKLCVSCKGCRRECPTGVDMARMKIEVLAARAEKHGISLRDRLVGYLPRYAPYATKFPWLLNLPDKIPRAAKIFELTVGFSSHRSLPKWRRDIFTETGSSGVGNKEVVLFADTFNRYFERENLDDARTVLIAAGYQVHSPKAIDGFSRPLCCGRTFLSVGKIDEAKHEAERCVAALEPYIRRGVSIVGLEPSCILGFRDEIPVLLKNDLAKRLAGLALNFEEFLAQEKKQNRLDLALAPIGKRALVHGHCHQKAFGVFATVTDALKLIPDLAVESIESSCCGMAGAFGYGADTIDVSLAMGELSLLPAVRKADANTLIVADGTSCRHQIKDGAGREALHVARVLAQSVAAAGRK